MVKMEVVYSAKDIVKGKVSPSELTEPRYVALQGGTKEVLLAMNIMAEHGWVLRTAYGMNNINAILERT